LIFTGPGAVVQSVAEQDGAGLLDLETRRFIRSWVRVLTGLPDLGKLVLARRESL